MDNERTAQLVADVDRTLTDIVFSTREDEIVTAKSPRMDPRDEGCSLTTNWWSGVPLERMRFGT